jgi:hypothetical protein
MKKMWFASRNVLAAATLACAFVFTSCDEDQEDAGMNMYSISGNANGTQMVPTVAGTGSATITGTYDANTNTLIYTTTWTGLSGNITSGGFFAGNAGQTGSAAGSAWTLGTTTGTASTFSGQTILTDAQETQLLNGGWYYTLGTATNTNGEVRGQITATRM